MKYQVKYARIEHQVYTLEIEANSQDEAEDMAEDVFFDEQPDTYDVVHAEEFVLQTEEMPHD
jgi:hypothetical protein